MTQLRFYNRQAELALLHKHAKLIKKRAQFIVVYGMRRVGKTFLLQHFAEQLTQQTRNQTRKLTPLYFLISKKPEELLLQEWTEIAKTKLAPSDAQFPEFKGIKDLLAYLFTIAKNTPLVIILDEFQDFLYVNPSIFSQLRNLWDTYNRDSKTLLIVSGSSYSLINRIFKNRNEPLFGRADAFLKIEPFKISTYYQILKDYDLKRKTQEANLKHMINLYSLFGTFPKYITYLIEHKLLNKQINTVFKRAFLATSEFFRLEGEFLLINDLGKDSEVYLSILQALSLGAKTSTQIAKKIGKKPGHILRYLNVLTHELGLLQEHTGPYDIGTKHYSIKNQYLAFYMWFVYRHKSLFEIQRYDYLYDIFKKTFPTFRGRMFEYFVRDVFLELPEYKNASFIGKFVQKNVEIDLITVTGNTWQVYEIKFKPTKLSELKPQAFAQKLEYLKQQLTKHNIQATLKPHYLTLTPLPKELRLQVKAHITDAKFKNMSDLVPTLVSYDKIK